MREQFRIRLMESVDLPRGTVTDIFKEDVTMTDLLSIRNDMDQFFGRAKACKAFGDTLPSGAHRHYRYSWEMIGTLGFRFHTTLLIERLAVDALI